LAAGDDRPASIAWQPVPGAREADLYPLIRKIDTISSNSYLIATPDALIMIDPGGLATQAEDLVKVLRECREEQDRPVFVFLTHAHIDHFYGVQSATSFAYEKAIVFGVQEAGARALEQGDGGITQGTLLNQPINPMSVALPLITTDRAGLAGVPCQLAFHNGAEVEITRDTVGSGPGTLDREVIRFGPGPVIEVLHTPGHSPDSICLRIGSYLFCGDTLFAANPGIAGIVGWSHESLIRSLQGISDLLATGEIDTVFPGHGRAIAGKDAVRVFAAVRRDAVALENIAELNSERAAATAAFAEDSMEQVNELFTIMAGRLYYVSYVVEELGEADLAEKTSSIIPGAVVDELLEAFRDYAEEHHRGSKISMHLALKAGQVIGKLERSFNKDELARIIDPSFARRAARLLSDYTTVLRGFTPPAEITLCDIRSLVEALVTGLSVPACSDEDLLSSADDDEAFLSILLARIGTRALLEDVEISLHADSSPVNGLVDPDDFIDLLTYIFEDLVGALADRIDISLRQIGPDVVLTISGKLPEESANSPRRTARFLQGLAVRSGGCLVIRDEPGLQVYEITVAASL
jgi:glyoxylase-like metal-dependent hydrolase (beta-lactamase superfamily II)